MGGKMGGTAFKASRELGLPRVPASWLLAFLLAAGGTPAFAQQETAACAPVIARVVSLQGTVEVQRAGTGDWLSVRRLDTSICAGDRLRTAPSSRAMLYVQPETLVRLDQNTTLTLQQSTDEISVEFSTDEMSRVACTEETCGAGYFITRYPKKFKVKTPHMNAAVEGTEFTVTLGPDATQLTVLEGKVASESIATGDRKLVEAGQGLASGAAGLGVITTTVKPEDAVQWMLRYPPLRDAGAGGDGAGIARAEAALQVGRVDEALEEINGTLAGNLRDANALALRSVIQLAKNDKTGALKSAEASTAADPGNYRGWLALSYAEQGSFDLEAALVSAQRAQIRKSNSSLVLARVAELQLSLGNPVAAEDTARAAVTANLSESSAHTILGFVHLAEIDTDAARTDFNLAIERDSFAALPRLGLGLAMIRDGELTTGREQLEIAVALDPGNSLLRSYVGKAYYEENTPQRELLASQQFDIAKSIDARDPTPWFYGAILKFSQSRPSEALADLHASSELNDWRAVYRSRQLLDLDLAARNASQAVVYNELGLEQLGLSAAARSLAADPGSGSAHRFLADIYATTPRHEIARASELLQSQLRLPLGAPPLQSQLANDVLFKNLFFGPASVGLNEFNSLFIRDDIQFQLYGMAGTDDTLGEQVVVNGLHGPVSFSLSQLATETDGYRENNDDSMRQYDGFVQVQPGYGTSIQLEATAVDRDSGDLVSSFDPGFFFPTLRSDLSVDTQRIGLRQAIGSEADVLVSVIHQDRSETVDIPDPLLPVTVITRDESWKSEIQYLQARDRWSLIGGIAYFDSSGSEEVVDPIFPFKAPTSTTHFNAYGYLQYAPSQSRPSIEAGVSYDRLESDVGELSEVNPKLGIIWSPLVGLTVRAAAFRALKREVGSDQGLEPTQVSGFNQFFDDTNGSVSEGVGLSMDGRVTPALLVGAQLTRRDLKAPFRDPFGSVFFVQQREEVATGYVSWTPTSRASFVFDPRVQEYRRGDRFNELKLVELPVTFRYISASGFRLGVSATAVQEEGVFDGPAGIGVSGKDNFWLVDASVGYRLPRRMGGITLEARNLLDEEFRFQEVDQGVTPRYVSDVQVLLRFSITF